MDDVGVAVLILLALAGGIAIGHRVRMGKPRVGGARAPAPCTGANGAPPYTFGVPVAQQIAAGCGCK